MTNMEELRQLSNAQILMGFVASCIEDVANRLGVDYLEAYKRMDAVGMIDQYLIPFYKTLHTESRENLTDSLIESLNLYHGGYSIIEHPDCLAGRDNLDFGKGFYTTLIREHAEDWAAQVTFNHGRKKPILNVYEFDKEKAIAEFNYRLFPAYDEVCTVNLTAMNNIVSEGKVKIKWESDESSARPKFVVT